MSNEQAGPSQEVIDELHAKYRQDHNSVPADWQSYFEAVEAIAAQQEALAAAKAQHQLPVESADNVRPKTEAIPVVADITRSDLPPAPPVRVDPPTSPYAARTASFELAGEYSELSTDHVERLRGVGAAIVRNMTKSLEVPTATSARQMPAKLMIENRAMINAHLARTRGGKISFTHLVGYAVVEALTEMPSMNLRFEEVDGKPAVHHLSHVGFGLAIDLPNEDGSRSLIVPVIHDADLLNFRGFVDAYEDLVRRARKGELKPADLQGASVTLTNPGTLGTTQSVPRLMPGQSCIIGVGATDFPAAWKGASPEQQARAGVGKVFYMTNTYDHRIIQGAGSGEFLRIVEHKLMGMDGFYERVFNALQIPIEPYAWERDYEYDPETEKGKPARIADLIHAYRSRGHLAADTDPLSTRQRRHPDLELASYGLSVWDLDRRFPTGGFGGRSSMKLREILHQLRDTYTRSLGIEYMHIQDPVQRAWMQRRIELPYEQPTDQETQQILKTLIRASAFETFLQTKYTGQKRFSLEGGESLIPLLDRILRQATRAGLHEVTIGMAHRGRLNVLANIAGKSYGQIFSEFEGTIQPGALQGSGDVKYHVGTSGVYSAEEGSGIKVSLAANPSHLEAADGVLEGITRAKQDRLELEGITDFPVLPVLIHGDAAFIGQGVVYETLNMSQLDGYRTGGTIHVIVNNQIGFTTGPTSARSTNYCTDLAKGLQVPIFHVNGDAVESVVRAASLAFAYRERFHKDVIIDMVCYRRRGHNEADDPSMTQPIMYSLIDNTPVTLEVYVRNLVGRKAISRDSAEQAKHDYERELSQILEETREVGMKREELDTSMEEGKREEQIGWKTAVSPSVIARIGHAHVVMPENFHAHPKLKQLMEKRAKMSTSGHIDWPFAELLAFGSLLMEGTPVRLAGEDSRRGTFVQRQAVLHDQETGEEWTPLQFLTENQAHFDVVDSSLSEFAPMGFEYGYSVERPEALVLWEAQFGDFANGAQTIIDEFVVSAQQKWGQRSSVVLLLPHGYEGQGPDHSSARIERFLTMAAEDNMRICQPSTPANYFHLLRAQAHLPERVPLILFSPKQLLRLSAATSPVEDFTHGAFQPVLDEVNPAIDPAQVKRLLLCSGRVYYDLLKRRDKLAANAIAIARIEQYYPLPKEELRALFAKYPQAELVWVQDEPRNQGAWPFLKLNLEEDVLGQRTLLRVSRPASASPSTGTMAVHKKQAEELLHQAFAGYEN